MNGGRVAEMKIHDEDMNNMYIVLGRFYQGLFGTNFPDIIRYNGRRRMKITANNNKNSLNE